METQNPQIHTKNTHNNNNNTNNNSRRGSNTHISMSDTESQTSQLDSFYSPLRFDSPPTAATNSKAIVSVADNSLPSPPPTPPPPKQVYNFSRSGGGVREGVKKVERREYDDDGEVEGGERRKKGGRRDGDDDDGVEAGERRKKGGRRDGDDDEVEGGGGERRKGGSKGGREGALRKANLGFRICQLVFCLVSFSVMAADTTRGWAGDSFDRYKEYRYCLAVNVIGFVYAGFQAFSSACYLASGKHILSHYHFEFVIDQILAYLLMSASSSAATRVDDWVSNWGKDTFTEMATASVGVSFLAFFAFAISALISGYNLCNRGSN